MYVVLEELVEVQPVPTFGGKEILVEQFSGYYYCSKFFKPIRIAEYGVKYLKMELLY